MQTPYFKEVSDFSNHVVECMEMYRGRVSMQKLGRLSALHNFERVIEHCAKGLQSEFNVPVYMKPNACSGSKSGTIGIQLRSTVGPDWAYFCFYTQRKFIYVVVRYQKNMIEGDHVQLSTMIET
jgi:hypothetical protein